MRELEDLLGREVVDIDTNVIRESLAGKVVLITGAGGSIGSELSRQIASFGPKRLVLFERSENDLYRIDRDLGKRHPLVDVVPLAGDILDLDRLDEVFSEYEPSAVLHAAAYKHVPMMEHQPFMAVRNNVFGTYNVTRACHEYGVESFLLISSDKAVNPASVMGVTKRIAEIVVLGFAALGEGRYNAVRFGNVLGSNGSVVPLFKEQIAAREPVTVTDPEVRRYFMTIPEAVRLVLQASTMGTGGEIFVLDMGNPVKIIDLARTLIRLSGLEPDRDIPIVFTGLRPGEKRCEELLLGTEGVEPTTHPKVMQLRSQLPEPDRVAEILEGLDSTSRSRDIRALVELLVAIVPEFTPSPSLLRLAESRSEADSDAAATGQTLTVGDT